MLKFLFARALALSVILAAMSFLLSGNRLYVPAGILAGSLASVYRLRMYSKSLTYFTRNKQNVFIKSLLLNLFSQTLSLIILVAAVAVNGYLFIGVAAGLVTTVPVICLNGLTEKIGLTHNNWQCSGMKN